MRAVVLAHYTGACTLHTTHDTLHTTALCNITMDLMLYNVMFNGKEPCWALVRRTLGCGSGGGRGAVRIAYKVPFSRSVGVWSATKPDYERMLLALLGAALETIARANPTKTLPWLRDYNPAARAMLLMQSFGDGNGGVINEMLACMREELAPVLQRSSDSPSAKATLACVLAQLDATVPNAVGWVLVAFLRAPHTPRIHRANIAHED